MMHSKIQHASEYRAPQVTTAQSDVTIITATPTTRIKLVIFEIEESRAGSRGCNCTRLRLVQLHPLEPALETVDFKLQALCSSWSAVIYSNTFLNLIRQSST